VKVLVPLLAGLGLVCATIGLYMVAGLDWMLLIGGAAAVTVALIVDVG
jgi:hypothetical protein